jgi:hypothetical protein
MINYLPMTEAPETISGGFNVAQKLYSVSKKGALHPIVSASGGIRDISNAGHMSKRALYDLMFAYLAGYEAGKDSVCISYSAKTATA